MIHLLRKNGTYGIQIFGILICIKIKSSAISEQINFILKIYRIELAFILGKETKYAKEYKENLRQAIKESKSNVAST